MAYKLRNRGIINSLIEDDENATCFDGNESEEEDIVSEQSEGSEYAASSDSDEEMADDENVEDASLYERLLDSRARGRPVTKLRGKNGFVWNTKAPVRQSGMYACVYEPYCISLAPSKCFVLGPPHKLFLSTLRCVKLY